MTDEQSREEKQKIRLAAVTKKLNDIEAKRLFDLSKEGKELNKQVKAAEAKARADAKAGARERRLQDARQETERLREEIAFARSKEGKQLRKEERKQEKLRKKAEKVDRDFYAELKDSLFGEGILASIADMFPKPVQILGAWGAEKFKKTAISAGKGIWNIGKSMVSGLMGKGPKPSETTAETAEVIPTENIAGKKFSHTELSKAHQMGKGPAFGTHPETGEALTDEQATALKEGGVVPDSIPQETILGDSASTGIGGEDGAPPSVENPVVAMDSIAGDSSSILSELQKHTMVLEEIRDILKGPDASVERELDIEGGMGGESGLIKGKKKKGGWLSKLFGGAAGGGIGGMLGGIGAGLAGLGKGIGGLGKGIGKAVGGILKGIAQGLIWFANPLVVAGAAAFGIAIAAVGAGLAGATWIMGKALPTFAEGMKSFEELDGDRLIQAGKGMAAVAGGMAAFGAGSAVAGLGSLVGSVTSGIVSLFGGDTPLEKMQKFQEYDFDAKKIKENADAMVAYGKAMATMGGAQAVEGLGAAVGAIASGIAGWFGGDDPLDKMLEFQEYNFDTAKITSNAAAVKAYGEAIKDFPQAPAASVFKSVKDSIIGLFGGDTDPFAPMVKFGELKLNTQNIINNAAAVKAYAEAVKDFPQEQPAASVVTAIKNAIIGFLGGETNPWIPLKAFGEIQINKEQVKNNAEAVKAYAEAVKDFPEKQPTPSIIGAVKGAIVGLLGGETDPFAPMKAFGELILNKEQIISNAEAVTAFGQAMSTVPEIDGERTGGLLGAIGNFFGGKKEMPWDHVKEFGEADMGDPAKVKANADTLTMFGQSLAGLSAIPEDIEKRLKDLGNGLEEFADYIDDGEIETLAEFSKVMQKWQLPIGGGLTNIGDGPEAIAKEVGGGSSPRPRRFGQGSSVAGVANTGGGGGWGADGVEPPSEFTNTSGADSWVLKSGGEETRLDMHDKANWSNEDISKYLRSLNNKLDRRYKSLNQNIRDGHIEPGDAFYDNRMQTIESLEKEEDELKQLQRSRGIDVDGQAQPEERIFPLDIENPLAYAERQAHRHQLADSLNEEEKEKYWDYIKAQPDVGLTTKQEDISRADPYSMTSHYDAYAMVKGYEKGSVTGHSVNMATGNLISVQRKDGTIQVIDQKAYDKMNEIKSSVEESGFESTIAPAAAAAEGAIGRRSSGIGVSTTLGLDDDTAIAPAAAAADAGTEAVKTMANQVAGKPFDPNKEWYYRSGPTGLEKVNYPDGWEQREIGPDPFFEADTIAPNAPRDTETTTLIGSVATADAATSGKGGGDINMPMVSNSMPTTNISNVAMNQTIKSHDPYTEKQSSFTSTSWNRYD